jgi:hypothetical protein
MYGLSSSGSQIDDMQRDRVHGSSERYSGAEQCYRSTINGGHRVGVCETPTHVCQLTLPEPTFLREELYEIIRQYIY